MSKMKFQKFMKDNGVTVSVNGTELPGMPEPDECGKAAQDLFDIINRMEQLTIDKREKILELIQALKRVDRVSVKVKDKTFVLEHMEEADVIKVKK